MKIDALDVVKGNEIITKRDAAGRGGRIDLNVLITAKTEQVGDRLAHLGHRQRLTNRGLNQAVDHRLVDRSPFGDDPNFRDALADESAGDCLGVEWPRTKCD